MTTATWSSSANHSSDATFRAWGAEVGTYLTAVGFVQTADTGQINWTTVTRPGINTDAGYEIFYLNDSLHGSAPIYLKIYYGTNNVTDRIRLRLEPGTGSNGSGTLTGGAGQIETIIGAQNSTGATALASYAAAGEGHGFLMFKGGSPSNTGGFFAICRTCDSSGTPTADGWSILTGGMNATHSGLKCRAVTAASWVPSGTPTIHVSVVPMSPASSLVGSDNQVYLNWGAWPRVFPLFASCHAVRAEYAYGTTFSVALVGATARTYLALSGGMGNASFANSSSTTYGLAFLYE